METRLSSQLSKREQEMIALQARMQASYQDHVAQTQKLNAKVPLIGSIKTASGLMEACIIACITYFSDPNISLLFFSLVCDIT